MLRRLLALPLALALLPALATGAAASCLFDDRPVEDRLGEFAYVFVGDVIETTDEGRTARFAVDEVWIGSLGPDVVVYGGPEQPLGGPTVGTSNDRAWRAGARYLVFAGVEERGLTDNACSPTREWDDELAAARPADASAPTGPAPSDATTAGGVGWLLPAAALGGAAVLGAAALVVMRRQRDVA